ncbi:unknown protein [Cronobacter turicensis z3032]|uniref:Uncharacterized protein n=1 Tax=Cronobacter turicensis (strain DSM 18703 / CCUG 55852 / LMG 23827 / z3032) TaxID=693216 RepID=C9XUA5_CROTZ|nr:unknown protein [Cronobacter turicensis z3032]
MARCFSLTWRCGAVSQGVAPHKTPIISAKARKLSGYYVFPLDAGRENHIVFLQLSST